MSKKEKLIEKIRNNPKNVSFDDLDKILTQHGFVCSQPRSGSSHYIYRRKGHNPITVPKAKPVKQHYVIEVLKLIDELEETDETEE